MIDRILRRKKSHVPKEGWLEKRIPSSLLGMAKKGMYIRATTYPIDKMIESFKSDKFVTRESKIVTMGSCFAQELKKWLDNKGFNCLPHQWGVVYTPQSIMQIVQYSLDPSSWNPVERFWVRDGKYYDPYRKADDHGGPMYLGQSEDEAFRSLENHYRKSAELLKEADLILFNLGLTEVFRNKEDKSVFYAIPFPDFYDENKHEFYNLTYKDVVLSLEASISLMRQYNKKSRFLLSIDPVPLSTSFREHLGAYIATQYSKSVLHAAAFDVIERCEGVYYMPSYDIVRNDPQKNYLDDGRHVTVNGVNTIMDAFKKIYVVD